MAKFKYVGNGQGVPGLPSELSDEEAKSLGVEQILKDAVKAGTFKKVAKKSPGGSK